jgi:thiamine pyrophosphokinase
MNIVVDLQPGVPVILADGSFPENARALEFIDASPLIICCDGAALKLMQYGREPDCIVGDMDSLPPEFKAQWQSRISCSDDQYTNDFTKAVDMAVSLGISEVVVLGISGLREDHALGNIGLLVEHGGRLKMMAVTDFGTFIPVFTSSQFSSFAGQQVSIFAITGTPIITSENLKYPLSKMQLNNWWMGTLNESIADNFILHFGNGGLAVFRTHTKK